MAQWNLWHGCTKVSSGCSHCYVYRRDAEFGKDASIVRKTGSFNLPVRKDRHGNYKLQPDGEYVYTCFTSDFFHPAADDWGDGYENVHISCTCENQQMANRRLPIFLELPIRHKQIIHEPMLEEIHIEIFLEKYHDGIELVSCGGESGEEARICDYGWVLQTMTQCVKYDVAFHFHQTGARFKRGEKIYLVDRKDQQAQAEKAGIDYIPSGKQGSLPD